MSTNHAYLLIVSADAILADITAFRLELLGYQVRISPSGEEALVSVREKIPDLLLIHLDLPGISGLGLIEQLATYNETASIPVLAISTNADMESVQRTITTGASDYLVVPYDPLILDGKVEQLLAEQAKQKLQDKSTTAKV
jgi:CheY-like chemotaxis protein